MTSAPVPTDTFKRDIDAALEKETGQGGGSALRPFSFESTIYAGSAAAGQRDEPHSRSAGFILMLARRHCGFPHNALRLLVSEFALHIRPHASHCRAGDLHSVDH